MRSDAKTGRCGWKGIALILAPAFASLVLYGCSDSGEEASSPTTGDATQGVTSTQILLGTHMPLSNTPAAAYAVIADGMKAYFEYTNSQGGVYGRKIKLIVGDDHYSAPDAVEVVRKLVEQDKVFAIVGGVGDSTHLAVMGYLAERGVPDLFISGGMPEFTDPLVKTRIAMATDYDTEGKIMTAYVKDHFAGQREGILYENAEAGRIGVQLAEERADYAGVKIVSEQAYDFGQFDLTSQMQRLRADNPDFVYLMANAGAAANAIKVARETLGWNVPFITSAVSAVETTIQLAGAQNAEGTVSATTGKMISETDDPGVQRHIELMKQFAPGVPPSSLTEYGMAVGEFTVQALKNAGADLTRESVIDGAEQIRSYCCISCLAPASLSPTDHRISEGMWYERVVNGKWERFNDTPVVYESTLGDVIACKNAGEPVYKSDIPATKTP
jgi:branched-chain amino acid transport system substrate-binding protein